MFSSFVFSVDEESTVCNYCDVFLLGKIVDFEDVSEVITASVLKVKKCFYKLLTMSCPVCHVT